MVSIRRFRRTDASTLWALADLIDIGDTGDPKLPLALLPAEHPPSRFSDLADIEGSFLRIGGEFLVAELAGHTVGMGGIRPTVGQRAEVKRVRVHPAARRRGVGRALMTTLEKRATELGLRELHLDTIDDPESMSFYRRLGYREVGREPVRGQSWILVYYVKPL